MAVNDLPEDPTSFITDQYVIANTIVLSAQRVIGRHEDAARTGRLILNATEQLDFERPGFNLPAILAHIALGNEEELRAMRDLYMDPEFRKASAFDPFFYIAYGQLDAEHAVELLLEHKAEYPSWLGTDVIAMNHSVTRPLVMHTDMQAFYLDEGKWLEYLATRVPGYEKYGS